MKTKLLILTLAALCRVAAMSEGQTLYINYPLSPSDITLSATGQVSEYVALWCPTNSPGTNWQEFGFTAAGNSNIVITPSVPDPCDIIVHSITTNGIRSANTNYVLFNTNVVSQWLLISNYFLPAPGPGAGIITN